MSKKSKQREAAPPPLPEPEDLAGRLAAMFLLPPRRQRDPLPVPGVMAAIVGDVARQASARAPTSANDVAATAEAAIDVLHALGRLAIPRVEPTDRYAEVVERIYYAASRNAAIELPPWPDDETMTRRTAIKHLEIIRTAAVKAGGVAGRGEPGAVELMAPPLLPDGDYLMPPVSKAEMARRLSVNVRKLETMLNRYDLRPFPPESRQFWTVRLGPMPRPMRDKLNNNSHP